MDHTTKANNNDQCRHDPIKHDPRYVAIPLFDGGVPQGIALAPLF